MVNVVGEAFDVINSGISVARDNYADAALSMAAAVPILGTAAGAGKLANRLNKVIKGAGQKPIIVGENIKRVKEYADKTGGHAYRPWKDDPFDFNLGMKRNERWIKDQMRNGREVIDT